MRKKFLYAMILLPLLVMGSSFTLGDKVWNDINQNWEEDIGESGYANVSVELYNEEGVKLKTTVTDAKGKYNFNNLKKGDYTVKIILPKAATEVTDLICNIWVDRDIKNLDFGIMNMMLENRDTVIPIDSNLMLGGEEKILYYADATQEENGLNRVLRVDYGNWDFDSFDVTGINPHSVDRKGESNDFYVRTQGSNSVEMINFETRERKTIELGSYTPRSTGATNLKYNISLIASLNYPTISVINHDTDEIIAVLGDTESPIEKGMPAGHPVWLTEDYCAHIDRFEKSIEVYKVEKDGKELSFKQVYHVDLKQSLHTLSRIRKPKNSDDLLTFYGVGETDLSKDVLSTIYEFKFNIEEEALIEKRLVVLDQSGKAIKGINPTAHHGGTSPDGKYYVMPVYDGKVYIIDRQTMKTVKVLTAGLGAGHVEFSEQRSLAVVTNHFAEEVTVIDMNDLKVVANVDISTYKFNPKDKHLMQAHFSHISDDGRYFYTFATQDGDFIEIDLENFKINRELHVGGAPEQSHS